MSKWCNPENTDSVLYLSNALDQITFDQLFSPIAEHFGPGIPLSRLRIEYVRWTHEEPCGCCTGSGTYGDFYRIELVEETDKYTVDLPLKALVTQ